jgi:pyrroline-5-carboxylate reductase
MPNTPCMVQEGAIVFSRSQGCDDSDSKLIKLIFSAVGPNCYEVQESMIDAVTGISGSGPAYMYIIIGIIYLYIT